MSSKLSKKAACPCGSGKKYKHCCATADIIKQKRNYRPYILGGAIFTGVVLVFAALGATKPAPPRDDFWPPIEEAGLPGSELPVVSEVTVNTGTTPQPPGLVPEGQVWDAEHGH